MEKFLISKNHFPGAMSCQHLVTEILVGEKEVEVRFWGSANSGLHMELISCLNSTFVQSKNSRKPS